jgi:Putative cyclase
MSVPDLSRPQERTGTKLAALFRTVQDLTHPTNQNVPNYAPTEESPYCSKVVATTEKDGYFARDFSLPEHFGTHIDAPGTFCPRLVDCGRDSLGSFDCPAGHSRCRRERKTQFRLPITKLRSKTFCAGSELGEKSHPLRSSWLTAVRSLGGIRPRATAMPMRMGYCTSLDIPLKQLNTWSKNAAQLGWESIR